MDLRVPSGSGSFLDELFSSGASSVMRDDADYWPNVQSPEVVEALARLFRGDIEYVSLLDDPAWIQTADAQDGYLFERDADGHHLTRYPTALSAEQVQTAFLAFLAGDVDCGLSWSAAPPAEPKKKHRWFGRG